MKHDFYIKDKCPLKNRGSNLQCDYLNFREKRTRLDFFKDNWAEV